MTTSLLNCIFNNLQKILKLKLGFYFRNNACFYFEARRRLVSATCMPLLDYGDILYMNASAQCLRSIDTLYHGTLRFILNCKTLTHHCTLYTWPSLGTRRLRQGDIFIYKAILGLLPFYLGNLVGPLFIRWSLSC